MKCKHFALLLIAFALLYSASYAALRLTGTFTHFSNANHWHAEKRSPGHNIGTPGDDVVLEAAFWPLRSSEELLHALLN